MIIRYSAVLAHEMKFTHTVKMSLGNIRDSFHALAFHSRMRISFAKLGKFHPQIILDYLPASSIATATATVILNLRVVTCKNQNLQTNYYL